ncbi:MAG: CNNM domain-containing protein, partial [Pseudomonadota bacterium]|nr:CNNM domain-containing protein [Pseudomonadota bacterium]
MLSFYQYVFVMVLLLCCSAFFSGSETAVMAVNRYRLQHKARVKKIPAAERLVRMLAKPERLLGMILIGNTFMNMMLSSLMTWVTMTYIGEEWVFVSTLMLTIIVLVFAE